MAASAPAATVAAGSPASLRGRTVLVFGGSSGMGKAAAVSVVQAGGIAWIVGRDGAKLDTAKAEILAAAGGVGEVRTARVDVTDESSVEGFFAAIPAGSVHHLVATVGASASASDITGREGFAKLRAQFDLKFFAQAVTVSYGAGKLADGGSIVLVSGALTKRPGKGSAALGAANAALEVLGRGLANDLGPRLRVNTVSPGLVDTEIWSRMPASVKEGMLAGFGSSVPCGRAGHPSDIGHAIRFLLENSWTTGTVLDVDGGAAIRP